MSELTTGFQSVPPEYRRVLEQAQDQHRIRIEPLQVLVGGWSGAMVYLVSVTHLDSQRVEHFILKLDRKSKTARSDELSRHLTAHSRSPAEFARDHLATLAFERVEAEGAIAIFYSIAGQSLQAFRPLSNYRQQHQLESIFTATTRYLLEEWNAAPSFATLHPQELLHRWLGFRLDAGAPVETFIRQVCRAEPERPGFLIQGGVFPNPLHYARQREAWGNARAMDAIFGLQHGDLNTNNILVRFSADGRELNGYYLIDFALFKEGMPLLYDLRYLEMSYLLLVMSQSSIAKAVDLSLHLTEGNRLDVSRAPVDMAGVSAVISIARAAFERWLMKNHPSLQDDLWGQYWLAGVAAGLSYCHKAGQAEEQRLAGLIYAAGNLKRYFGSFSIPLPTEVDHLYSDGNEAAGSSGTPRARKPHHNLPVQPTAFIGRTAHIAALKKMILDPSVRLVTLLGPGGAGKTRLSLEVAQEVLDHFPQGVFFVPLADDTEPNQFISRVAQQLEVREGGRSLLENIKDYLRNKHLLLVLDNFEQLMSAAPILGELLAAATQLKILTSSRIALKLHAEQEYPVPPLKLPPGDEATAEDLAHNEAVTLFVDRARASKPTFALTDENASAIAEICRRLDGLPLALELAAARVKMLSPQAILTRLDDRLKLLTGGARDLPFRHQALRNTLEWSYSLLNEEEKSLYARLGVFVGGFTLEAAEAVCNPDGRLDILEGLTSLVNNSLVRQEETIEGEPRFGMLETIRAYALERLAASGEMEALRAQHARYFGGLVLSASWTQLSSSNALRWLNWLEREHDNIRATLAWCLSTSEGIELAAGMVVSGLEWFWYRRGYFMEGRMWSERLLASPFLKAASLEQGMILVTSSAMALWQGKPETALAESLEALALGQRHEDELVVTMADLQTAVIYINMGQDREAQPLLAEAQAYFKEQNQAFFFAVTNIHLGNVELGLGNVERARALHEEALTVARTVGENWLLSFALNNLGEVARTQGQYDLARTYYEESEALLRDTGDKGDLARFVHTLGYIAQHEGDYTAAEDQFKKSLTMFRELGNRRGMAECMAGLAGLKARQGQAEWGAMLLSAAEAILKSTGGEWWPADRVEVEANQKILRSALSETELAAAQTKGRSMTLEQALAFVSEGP
ncbi:MAG TPA: tetratricopeptide repeat protein [Anaerolineales bacterium]|nr:tetratricopeptide repeat protein [Anaerolineales bacterium]